MSEMIDRIAKIIDPVAFGTYPDEDIDPRCGATWANVRFAMRERAQACLQALREPTSSMLAVAQIIHNRSAGHPTALWSWQSMIDEALKAGTGFPPDEEPRVR